MNATQAMLVGADTLGNITAVLNGYGIEIHRHLTGRNSAHQRKQDRLPAGTELLILFTDFLGHNVMKTFRAAAQRSGIKIVACRRSVCSVKAALTQEGYCENCPYKQLH